MSTSRPRIAVTLTPHQYAVLQSISTSSGQSMSSFVGELIEQSLPVLERMAQTFKRIKEVQDGQRRRIADELTSAQAEVEPVLEQVLSQFDLFSARVEKAAGLLGSENPRSVITGVTIPTSYPKNTRLLPSKKPAKPAKARAKAV